MKVADHIFGYGSLACPDDLDRFLRRHGIPPVVPRYARLRGFRRAWNVAHDNETASRGLIYVDPRSGARHRGAVAFLNVYRAGRHAVNGMLFPVPAEGLVHFDRRELHYERIDVTADVETDGVVEGRVWVYVAGLRGMGQHSAASAAGRAVIPSGYVGRIEAAFAALGEEAFREYLQSTDRAGLPLRNLEGVELPAGT
jgi:hypothetical protein